MANTYTQLFVHLVIVVQDRQSILTKELKEILYPYISGIQRTCCRQHLLHTLAASFEHMAIKKSPHHTRDIK